MKVGRRCCVRRPLLVWRYASAPLFKWPQRREVAAKLCRNTPSTRNAATNHEHRDEHGHSAEPRGASGQQLLDMHVPSRQRPTRDTYNHYQSCLLFLFTTVTAYTFITCWYQCENIFSVFFCSELLRQVFRYNFNNNWIENKFICFLSEFIVQFFQLGLRF